MRDEKKNLLNRFYADKYATNYHSKHIKMSQKIIHPSVHLNHGITRHFHTQDKAKLSSINSLFILILEMLKNYSERPWSNMDC